MNRHPSELTTTAAEGLPRRRFTVAELEQMTAAGILQEDERIELIGGEIVPMSPKGNHHEILKMALMLYWARVVSADVLFTTETTFRLSVDTYLEPYAAQIEYYLNSGRAIGAEYVDSERTK